MHSSGYGLPFVYTPRPGEHIKIDRRGGGAGGFVITVCGQSAGSIAILAEEASGFAVMAARAICEAAGKPEPVILERPEIDRESIRGVAGWRPLFSGRRDRDGRQFIAAGYGTHPCADLSSSEARELATFLAAYADLAEAEGEPDPAEVEELAALMDAEMERRANGQSGLYPAVARIALQWMNSRQQRGEQS